jgi:hypothetical protein
LNQGVAALIWVPLFFVVLFALLALVVRFVILPASVGP